MKPKTLNEEINRIKNIMGFINESMDEPTGETQEFNGKTYPSHHGSPFDRGSADSWYSRGTNPHKNHPEYSEDFLLISRPELAQPVSYGQFGVLFSLR